LSQVLGFETNGSKALMISGFMELELPCNFWIAGQHVQSWLTPGQHGTNIRCFYKCPDLFNMGFPSFWRSEVWGTTRDHE
jgi:hypothetical protein